MGKPVTEAQKRAILKYDASNTKQYHLKLNLKNDADIIEKFEIEKRNIPDGIQGYIKRLIRKDLHGGE